MSDPWGVVEEQDRVRWSLDPLKGVGPLQFGMPHDDVAAALSGLLQLAWSQGRYGTPHVNAADFNLEAGPIGPALSCYYSTGRLAAVAVNALRGPQVTLDGLRLVGRVPSVLEREFTEHADARGHDLRYSQTGDPASEDLGMVLRAQRAGDVVLSRPVVVSAEWAERCHDTQGTIPIEEWHRAW